MKTKKTEKPCCVKSKRKKHNPLMKALKTPVKIPNINIWKIFK
jgi:hypothetical protein